MFGRQLGCKIRDVYDGTSHTIMIAEVTGGGGGSNKGYPWLIGSLMVDVLDGINGPFTLPGVRPNWKDTSGGVIWGFRLAGPSSYHPGGCNFALGDASVQFISQDINQAVLEALATRAGGEVIDAKAAF